MNNEPKEVDIIQDMQNNNISLPTFDRERLRKHYVQATKTSQFSEQTKSDAYAGYYDPETGFYREDLDRPIELSGEEELTSDDVDLLNQYIASDQVLNGSEYEFFKYLPHRRQIVYTQKVDGLPVADGTSSIRLVLNEQGNVVTLEQNFAGLFTQQGEEKELYSDEEAVKALFQRNLIPANSKVKKPVLTYYRTLELKKLSVYIPVWYVEIQTQNETFVERINALDLTTITENPDTLQEQDSSQVDDELDPLEDDLEEEGQEDEEDSQDTE